ncbi:hypothetical protein [Miltoncostaea marina]|uniref:hypothetical protein n=1 Tax=Miltoncostaea marina TaxID=2843215 RepID=UPI001C3D1358|nr:hypothetical protein [Miltoncostaea marina]
MGTNLPPEFDDRGIKPLTHIPELPPARQTSALVRQLVRDGVRDPDGTQVATYSQREATQLAYPWVYPRQVSAQIVAPHTINTQAGTLFMVHGLVLTTRIMPPYHNSRARPKLAIPPADAAGKVNTPWPTRDVSADPTSPHRLLVSAEDARALADAARATAEHVEAMQGTLKDILAREGVEEPVLLVGARFALDHGALPNDLVELASDGGSRVTIQQGHLAAAAKALVSSAADTGPLASQKLTLRRLDAIAELGVHLEGRVAGLMVRDPQAERDLRDYLDLLQNAPAKDLAESGLYAGQRALVIPARAVVAFRSHGGTLVEAVGQLVGNAHKRGPKPWDPEAINIDTRDEMLRHLYEAGAITSERLALFGPRFEEAETLYGGSANPDYRIGALVRLIHGGDPLSDEARRAARRALRVGRLSARQTAQIAAAAVLEQFRTGSTSERASVEATLNEIMAGEPFKGGVTFGDHDPDVETLVEDAIAEQQRLIAQGTPSVFVGAKAKEELTVKGGVALTFLGALRRRYAGTGSERAYQVLARVARDERGLALMGEAIAQLRSGGDRLPALDPETWEELGKTAKGDVIPMDLDNLLELFPTTTQQVAPQRTTPESCVQRIVALLSGGVSDALEELEGLPGVNDRGVVPSPELAKAIDLLTDYRDRLVSARKTHERYYADAEPAEEDRDDEAAA